jgi:hypothetical protein
MNACMWCVGVLRGCSIFFWQECKNEDVATQQGRWRSQYSMRCSGSPACTSLRVISPVHMRPNLQNNQSKMDWRCGSSDRIPALQAQSPEFKPQSHQKKRKKRKETTLRVSQFAWSNFSKNLTGKENDMRFSQYGSKKVCQSWILWPAKLSFKNEGKIKTFPDKSWENISPPDLFYKKC